MKLTEQLEEFRQALEAGAQSYGVALNAEALDGLSKYYALLNTWNARVHLVAPTSPREFATRHVLESLMLLDHLPTGAAVADIGSGGGLPIIPCLIARPDLHAVMIEASPKKAVFLNEAIREVLEQDDSTRARARVVAARFETAPAPEAGFITCRALERFEAMLPAMLEWAPENSTLLLFGGEGLQRKIQASGLDESARMIPNSERRFLLIVKRSSS